MEWTSFAQKFITPSVSRDALFHNTQKDIILSVTDIVCMSPEIYSNIQLCT